MLIKFILLITNLYLVIYYIFSIKNLYKKSKNFFYKSILFNINKILNSKIYSQFAFILKYKILINFNKKKVIVLIISLILKIKTINIQL